jgi:hypothetical protein
MTVAQIASTAFVYLRFGDEFEAYICELSAVRDAYKEKFYS